PCSGSAKRGSVRRTRAGKGPPGASDRERAWRHTGIAASASRHARRIDARSQVCRERRRVPEALDFLKTAQPRELSLGELSRRGDAPFPQCRMVVLALEVLPGLAITNAAHAR